MGEESDAVDRSAVSPVPVQNLGLNRIRISGFSASLLRLDHHGASKAGVVLHASDWITKNLKRYVDPGHVFMGMRIWVEVRVI